MNNRPMNFPVLWGHMQVTSNVESLQRRSMGYVVGAIYKACVGYKRARHWYSYQNI